MQPFRPLPPPDAVDALRGRGTFEEIVRRAAGDLRGQGWDVVKERLGAADPWHVAGQRGQKLRVVQVVPPPRAPSICRTAARRSVWPSPCRPIRGSWSSGSPT